MMIPAEFHLLGVQSGITSTKFAEKPVELSPRPTRAVFDVWTAGHRSHRQLVRAGWHTFTHIW